MNAETALPPAVPPSTQVRVVLRPLTKVLNPLIVRLAGRRHFGMAGELSHVGRRSGRTYVTPVGTRRAGDVVVIPLTFGNRSDWSQNVLAAGRCSVKLRGQHYALSSPELLARADAGSLLHLAFTPLERASFTALGITQFMRLQITDHGA
ncbi:MAG TPA: nitroreductase family deazaflavin-dependent oxidoreductase [Streptosporangiaceae bacterium]|nr:nitroreductase family deazaflavin-dependent oxidoreductase [Streptosporangiaceae bacterium]